jgi:hypothetical protein
MARYFQKANSVEAKEESGHADHFGIETPDTRFSQVKVQEFWMKW